MCEALESRHLLSSSISLSAGVIIMQGDPTAASSLTAGLTDGSADIYVSAGTHDAMSFPASSVYAIHITAGSGADSVFVATAITLPVVITAGNGNDTIQGGGGENAVIVGNGNDSINGRGTVDYISVGNGNDTIYGSNGNNTIIAGGGTDQIVGGSGNDSITAGNGNDAIDGNAGNDTITAGNGADTINGGLGNDTLTVGTGDSTVIPGSGTNYIVLGNPKTVIVPSSGQNTVVTSTGAVVSSPVSSNPTPASPTWISYDAPKPAISTSPQAILQVLEPDPVVGIVVNVRALDSTLGVGSPIDAQYIWNFGDPSGAYNTLDGYNAAHVYNQPGNYTISLTVENNQDQSSTAYAAISITADNRKAIYVDSVHGSDKNNGSSPSQAVQTAVRADELVTNNTEVFFDRGEEFNLSQSFLLHAQNILVGAYGSGAQPIINYTNPVAGSNIFSTNNALSDGVTIENLTFTTENGTNPSLANQPMAIMAGGYGTTVIDCTFMYVEYAVNGSGNPVGLTVENCSSPTFNGLQGYFVWDQGTDTTVIDNTVEGSVHEHVLRSSGATELLIYDNNFYNNDGKGCIEIHEGSYAWIQGNTANGGDIRVGPLGLWGEPITSSTNECVIEDNTVLNNQIAVYPGAHDISIRNNIIKTNSAQMIDVKGQDGLGRQSADIRILNNTGISTGATGNFLKVENHTDGIILENNLLVQPKLAVGGYDAAPVFVAETNLSSFTSINGNVWQLSDDAYAYAGGGDNYIDTVNGTGYVTPAQWNAYSVVGTDYFVNTSLASNLAPVPGSVAASAASAISGVFTDFYGTTRPKTGAWTAGAVQG
jgi:hypothetical protein